MKRRLLRGKKLLIASAGLATVTFLGCPRSNGPDGPPGNLMPPPEDPPTVDGSVDGAADGTTKPEDPPPPIDPPPGNLMPPPEEKPTPPASQPSK